LQKKVFTIDALKERIGKQQEQEREKHEARKLEQSKLIDDMNFLTAQNELLEAEISKLKAEREEQPKLPSPDIQRSIIEQVSQCRKLVTTLQNELDVYRKISSAKSHTPSDKNITNGNDQSLKRKNTDNVSKAGEAKKKRQYAIPAHIACKVLLRNHRGFHNNTTITVSEGITKVKFGMNFSTVAATSAIATRGHKVWFEVQYIHRGLDGVSGQQIGFATPEFPACSGYADTGVGDGIDSYGFDPFFGYKYHGGGQLWGDHLGEKSVERVIGVALDLVHGEILYSLNGVWKPPMGAAFTGLNLKCGKFFPAISGCDATLEVNLGGREFIHGPPDVTYESVVDEIKSS